MKKNENNFKTVLELKKRVLSHRHATKAKKQCHCTTNRANRAYRAILNA
jgi:hypothetical protein